MFVQAQPPATPVPTDAPTGVFRLCQDVVEVKQHRRIRKGHRGDYAASVVREIKNRLGTPRQTEDNFLAVRRMANNIMEKHGLRPSHVGEVIERVIAGVFIPDDEDQVRAEMLASLELIALRRRLESAGPSTAYQRLWQSIKAAVGMDDSPRSLAVEGRT
nr:hypothetical protein [Forsythia suspensa tombusvirus]